jgi:tRNA uridine 5-carboxymethylaminomethyl modification enzyme
MEVYVQGFFTSMPEDVQRAMLHSIPALRDAEIMRPGYAIEYDHVPTDQILPSLETKRVEGLFLAGQINGTSGYEEAAGQGLLAGINAARKTQARLPVILRRDEAYIGVMVDDLITKEIDEPYRLMTSRAEYRLLLRQDNAELRLADVAYDCGLISREEYDRRLAQKAGIESELSRLRTAFLRPDAATNAVMAAHGLEPLDDGMNALMFLSRPEVRYSEVAEASPPPDPLSDYEREQVEIEAKYAGYAERQREQVERTRRLEEMRIPDGLDYSALTGLRNEAKEKLEQKRPATVGQASRLSGVNPADIAVLLIHMQRVRG